MVGIWTVLESDLRMVSTLNKSYLLFSLQVPSLVQQ